MGTCVCIRQLLPLGKRGHHEATACPGFCLLTFCQPHPTPGPRVQAYGPAALTAGLTPGQRRQLAIWLGACSAWVFVLVVVGGITRLTRSGLSMTSWKFTGERPPSTPVRAARRRLRVHPC